MYAAVYAAAYVAAVGLLAREAARPTGHHEAVSDDPVGEAVADLYALDRDQFVAARDHLAVELRRSGDRAGAAAVKKLGHPTVAAWAVNQLVRAHPETARRIADLGVRLRDAQAALDVGALKALRPQRDVLLAEAVHAAATVAAVRGQPLGVAADQVRATLVAALADPAAADAVASGRLVRALSYAGFGEVQLDDAVAALPTPAGLRPVTRTSRPVAASTTATTAGPQPATDVVRAQAARQQRADQRVGEAESTLREAERRAAAAAADLAQAQDRHAAAARRTAQIRVQLSVAEQDERAVAALAAASAVEAEQSRAAVAEASAEWTRARAERDALG